MKQCKIILLMICGMIAVVVSSNGLADSSMFAPAGGANSESQNMANLKCASSNNIMNCFQGAGGQASTQSAVAASDQSNDQLAAANNTSGNNDLQEFPQVKSLAPADMNYRNFGYGTQVSDTANQASAPSSVNSNQFTNSGPFSLGYRYDQNYKSMLYGAYGYMFNPYSGFSLKGDFGRMEHRLNATVGYTIGPHQQIKLTYELLAQKMPFSFVTGKVNEWMHQNAFGGAYRYLLDNPWVQSVSVNASYIKAASKSLKTIAYTGSDNLLYDDIRHIAGGTEKALDTAITLTPMHNMFLTLGVGYSTLKYNTLKMSKDASIQNVDNNKNSATFDYSAKATDVLSASFKASVSGAHNASGDVYGASLSHIFGHAFEATMSGNISRGHGNLPNDHSMILHVSYPAPNAYTAAARRTMSSLKSWIQTPVVYESQVLAVKDEYIKNVIASVSSSTIPDQTVSPVDSNSQLLQAAPSAKREITPINFTNYFHENPSQWDSVHYNVTVVPNDGYGQSTNNGGNCSGSGLPALGLTCVAGAPYGATLKSIQTVPLQAASHSQYTITVTASFIRNGKIMAHRVEAFHVNMMHSDKRKPTFKAGFELPTAYRMSTNQLSTMSDKYHIDLETDINNPANSGALKVTASGLPDGLTLKGTVLSGTVSSFVKVSSYPVHFVLSNLIGGDNPITKNLTVAAMPSLQWEKQVVLPATIDIASTKTIDLLKDGYVTDSDKTDTVTFGTKQTLPAWIQLSSDGTLTINPKINTAVSQLKNVVFTATSKKTGQVVDSQPQTINVEFYAKDPPTTATGFGAYPENSAAYVIRNLQPHKLYIVKALSGTVSKGTVSGYFIVTGEILTAPEFLQAAKSSDMSKFYGADDFPVFPHPMHANAKGEITVFLTATANNPLGPFIHPNFTTVRVAAAAEAPV